MDVGFVILCPNRNIGGLYNTLWTINHHSYNREAICVVGNDTTAEEMKEFRGHCPTYKGKDTITSLINTGIKRSKHDWAFFLFAGSRLQQFTERQVAAFVEKDSDIIHPVVDKRTAFYETSLNGVTINCKFFKEVGNFPTQKIQKYNLNDFEFAKLMWGMDAIEHGATFKGVLGLRIL